jgi:hypothetical protein
MNYFVEVNVKIVISYPQINNVYFNERYLCEKVVHLITNSLNFVVDFLNYINR